MPEPAENADSTNDERGKHEDRRRAPAVVRIPIRDSLIARVQATQKQLRDAAPTARHRVG
jgi:hypothetical protein